MTDIDLAGWLVFVMFGALGVGLLFADADQERTEAQLKKWNLYWRGLPIYKSKYSALRFVGAAASIAIAGIIYFKILGK